MSPANRANTATVVLPQAWGIRAKAKPGVEAALIFQERLLPFLPFLPFLPVPPLLDTPDRLTEPP